MLSGFRNNYAFNKIAEMLTSTQVLLIMNAFVVLAGCIMWVVIRGMYGEKISRLRYIVFWMILTQLVYLFIYTQVQDYWTDYDAITITLLRIAVWVVSGLITSVTPLINRPLTLSLFGRVFYLVGVHVIMRLLLFTIIGAIFTYGLQNPKLLLKIAKIAPACHKGLLCVIRDL